MAIRQLLSLRSFVPDSLGNPARTAYMHIFEPGTQTRITSYKDGALQNANVNPVPFSASGKASVWVSRDCDVLITLGPLITDPVLVNEPNANPDTVGAGSSGLVPNGSFEQDSDANDVPDGWVEVAEIGSANGLDTSVSSDGLQSFRFTSVGTGGGSLTTEDFFAVNDVDDLRVNFDIQSSVVDVRNIVRVEWYDISQVPISNTDVYDNAVSNPLTFTPQALVATPPAGARFAKLRLIGADPSDVTPGSTWYDRVNVFYPLVVSGVFDNITIQNNEIVSTNTDGDIQLRPDGNGQVAITSGGTVDLTDVLNPLNIGNVDDPSANPHIAVDATQIQAKADATNTNRLDINPLGGLINLGAQSGSGHPESYYNGSLRQNFGALATINFLNDDADTPASGNAQTGPLMRLQNVNALSIAQWGFENIIGTNALQLSNLVEGGNVVFQAIPVAGSLAPIMVLDPDAASAVVTGTLLELDAGANLTANMVAQNTIGGVRLGVEITTGLGRLSQLSGAGAFEDSWATFTRNGGVSLFANNVETFIVGTAEVEAVTATYVVDPATAGTVTMQMRNNAFSVVHELVTATGQYRLYNGNASGAINDLIMTGTRNGATSLYQNGAETARTITAATGGLQANNTLTGSGFERVLTTSDSVGSGIGEVQGAVRTSSLVRNNTTLVDDPVLSGFPLQPSAEYVVECVLIFDGNGNAAAGFQWNWDFNGELPDIETLAGRANSHQQDNSSPTLRSYQFAQLGSKFPFDNLTIDESVHMTFGLVTQSDYIADTEMDLQWACGTGVTDCRIQEGSFVKVTRVA